MQLNSTEISELIKQRIAQFNVVSEARSSQRRYYCFERSSQRRYYCFCQ
ncbi:hypothetical protein LTSEBAI_5170 [Salmonella enterica subsp. enterica serovar Baildon str. R6-199]|nr:hypothetical protein LTSEBAI_5170 [Salmonella enterica subsp. enterica serovar Baildon str. R6-199]